MDSSHCPSGPQRLSALYQYHNAPEVAPAHGLEYDDTKHPSSDKFPAVRDPRTYAAKLGKYGFAGDNRPPRIIFGMKIRTFLLVALVMVCIVVGAAVGGAVGGQQLRAKQAQPTALYTNGTNSPVTLTSKATATSTFSPPTPTYTPLNDCPGSNNTEYTSQLAGGSSGMTPGRSGLKFTKYCDVSNPLSADGARRIVEAYVYSFSDCVEVCAAYNFWNDGSTCTAAIYQSKSGRPGNCWVGNAGDAKPTHLHATQGTNVAILHS